MSYAPSRSGKAENGRSHRHDTERHQVLELVDGTDAPNYFTEGYRDPQALERAIGALPSGQRTAIELLKLRNMSLKEAARASGTSVGALKVATHRAMSALGRY